jgi:diacylglycerol kinase
MSSDVQRPDSRKPLVGSFRHAVAGWRRAVHEERNLRIHLLAAVAVAVLSWYLRLSGIEGCLIVLAVAAVWMAELFNTALEQLVDLVSPEYHDLARGAKDVAAAAVLTAAVASVLIGLLIFLPHVIGVLTAAGDNS